MSGLSLFFRRVITGVLAVTFLCAPLSHAEGEKGGNADAKKGNAIATILPIVGAVTVGIGVAKVASQDYSGVIWIVMGIAEIAGGMMAAGNNAKTEAETRGQMPDLALGEQPPLDGAVGFQGLPDGLTPQDLCTKAGSTCSCRGPACANPNLTLPTNLDDIRSQMSAAYAADPNAFGGKSLDEALSDFDSNYKLAQQAVDNFNKASEGGVFNPSGGRTGAVLASSGSPTIGDDGNLDAAGAGLKGKRGTGDGFNGENGNGNGGTNTPAGALANGINGSGGLRTPVRPVNRHPGLQIEDARTGRLLTIFERVSRAIRSQHDRDLTLAKLEWARKEMAKKKNKERTRNSVAKG